MLRDGDIGMFVSEKKDFGFWVVGLGLLTCVEGDVVQAISDKY